MTEMAGYGQEDSSPSCLTQKVIDNLDDASAALSRRSGSEIPVVAVVKPRSALSCTVSLPTEYWALWNVSGAHVESGQPRPGVLSIKPFNYRVSHLVTKEKIPYVCPLATCPTADNVMVTIKVNLNFSVNVARDFVYNLGAVRADELIKAGVEEGVRSLVRKALVAQVLELRGSKSVKLLDLMRKKFTNCGVNFDSVQITEVSLPSNLQSVLTATTQMKRQIDSLNKQQDTLLKDKERQLQMAFENLQRKNKQEIQEKLGDLNLANALKQTMVTRMNEERETAIASAAAQVDVMKKKAESEKERAQNLAETNKNLEITKAQEQAKNIKIEADADKHSGIMDSVEELAQAHRDAKAIELDAAVEAKMSEQVRMQREHLLSLAQRKVLATLAEKGHYNLIGKAGDVMLKSMMEGDFNESDFKSLRN